MLIGLGLVAGKLFDLVLPGTYREAKPEEHLVRCPQCGRRATLLDALPLGEAFVRGRCPECRTPIPIRWLLLPVATAALATACYAEYGTIEQALVGTLFSAILLTLVFTDLERRVLPDRLIIPATVLAAGMAWSLPEHTLADSGYGALAGLIVAAILTIGSLPFGRGAFGMGDAKLIVFLGVLLGARHVLVAVVVAFMAIGLIAAGLLVTRQTARGSHLPLGPFLAVGGIATLIWGDYIWNWWVQ